MNIFFMKPGFEVILMVRYHGPVTKNQQEQEPNA